MGVINEDGRLSILDTGKAAVADASGNCPECCGDGTCMVHFCEVPSTNPNAIELPCDCDEVDTCGVYEESSATALPDFDEVIVPQFPATSLETFHLIPVEKADGMVITMDHEADWITRKIQDPTANGFINSFNLESNLGVAFEGTQWWETSIVRAVNFASSDFGEELANGSGLAASLNHPVDQKLPNPLPTGNPGTWTNPSGRRYSCGTRASTYTIFGRTRFAISMAVSIVERLPNCQYKMAVTAQLLGQIKGSNFVQERDGGLITNPCLSSSSSWDEEVIESNVVYDLGTEIFLCGSPFKVRFKRFTRLTETQGNATITNDKLYFRQAFSIAYGTNDAGPKCPPTTTGYPGPGSMMSSMITEAGLE